MSISSDLRTFVSEPTKELEASLAEISTIVSFLSNVIRLRPRLNEMIRWDHLGHHEQALVTEFLENKNVNENTAHLSLIVVCYGVLERYLRQVIERAVNTIDKTLVEFDTLPKSLANENVFRTGQALMSVRRPHSYIEYEFSGLAQNLGKCVAGSNDYRLNAECFVFAHGTLTSENLDNVLERIGVKIDWQKFGSKSELKELLGETRTVDCTKKIKSLINDLAHKRNIISHSGGTELAIDAEQVELLTKFIPIFCEQLIEQVASSLQKNHG